MCGEILGLIFLIVEHLNSTYRAVNKNIWNTAKNKVSEMRLDNETRCKSFRYNFLLLLRLLHVVNASNVEDLHLLSNVSCLCVAS